MIKNLKLLCVLLLCAIVSVGCGGVQEKVVTLKLAHGLSPTHSVHLGLVRMDEELQRLSDGKMRLQIYPSAQLGSESSCVELLQIGSLDITKVSAATLESFADPFKVFGIPYIFHSKDHLYRVVDGEVGGEILDSTIPYLFKGIAYFDSGARSFYTIKKQINRPEDLHGLKIRVMKSPIAVEMMQSFGSSATPIDWGELYTALQSNVVDGSENNTPSITTSFHHEVTNYYSQTEHIFSPDVIVISTKRWNSLSVQQQEWINEAAKLARLYQRELWAEQENISLDIMKKKGMEIVVPDKQPFIDCSEPMRRKYASDPKFKGVMEKIEALQ